MAPSPPSEKTYRQQVIDLFTQTFDEHHQQKHEISRVTGGDLHRWTLERGPYLISLYVTIDSPEFEDIAHIMVSDGSMFQVNPVANFTIRTMDEARELLQRILAQWQRQPVPPGPAPQRALHRQAIDPSA